MSARIDDLEPETRKLCLRFVDLCDAAGYPVVICQTLRTPAEQELLYAKGRTRPGEPCHHGSTLRSVGTCIIHPLGATVTQLRFGWHNCGRAFDFLFVLPDGKRTWEGDWTAAGQMGESIGLVWGGRWKSPDRPHLESSKGLVLKDQPGYPHATI
jgi:peptidoglycan L-alanyl-D-glutamate endopeptidase CwlK